MKPFFLIFIVFTFAKAIYAKNIIFETSGIAKVGQDDLDSEVLTEVEKVSKNLIAEVDVAGYVPTTVKVYPSGTQFRAFVLLTYSEKEARKVIVNRMRKNRLAYSKLKATDAWKELEDEVEKSKQDEKAIL